MGSHVVAELHHPLVTLALVLPVTPWVVIGWLGATVALFGIPESTSLLRKDDSLPPLTHTIRHFLPNWFAFPLIYGLLGAIGGRWLGFEWLRYLGVGAMFGLLGWLSDHFTVTYARPDPFPFGTLQGAPGREPPPRIQPERPV